MDKPQEMSAYWTQGPEGGGREGKKKETVGLLNFNRDIVFGVCQIFNYAFMPMCVLTWKSPVVQQADSRVSC